MSAIATFGDLKDAVKSEVMRQNHRGFSEAMPRMMAFAESRIYDGGGDPFRSSPVRVTEMEVTANPLTFTNGSAAVPADFMGARLLYWDADIRSAPVYEPPTSFRLNRVKEAIGYPSRYTIEGGNVLLSPAISGDLVFDYYARPTALAADSDTNAVLVKYPSLYFNALLFEAYGYLRDAERRAEAFGLYTSAVNGIIDADQKKKTGGLSLYPRIRNSWIRR